MERVDLSLLTEKTAGTGTDGLPVVYVIRAKSDFYHYLCDGVDDRVSMLKGVRQCPDDLCVITMHVFIHP